MTPSVALPTPDARLLPGWPRHAISPDGRVWVYRKKKKVWRQLAVSKRRTVELWDGARIHQRTISILLRELWPAPQVWSADGPTPHGSAHGRSKLTEHDVREIRRLRAAEPRQWTYKALCARFEVSPGTLSFILAGKTWRHVS